MSSSAIYGIPKEIPVTEKTPYEPVEIYGKSKLEAEKVVWAYMQEGGGASCIRPRTIIGGESRLGIFQILFEWISEDRNVYVLGNGNHLFQFIHVDDLINVTIKAAHAKRCGLYNIGSEKFSTLRDILEKLIIHAKKKSRVKSLPANLARAVLQLTDWLRISPLAPYHYLVLDKPYVFDITKPIRELDWYPQYSDEEAIIESYEWYIKNKNNFQNTGRSVHKKPVRQKILRLLKWIS